MLNQIDQLLSQVQKPLTYIACEDNACIKKQANLRFCLIYPDLYELGIASLGINILYSVLNKEKNIWAQRAYMPDVDAQQYLLDKKLPLFSLEERKPLKDFDILGFSLPHELCYTNILKILELAQIPIKSSERNEQYPLIIAGGNGAYNPLPLSPFIDAFVIGEGEEVILEIVEAIRAVKNVVGRVPRTRRKSEGRSQKLKALSAIEGVWVPKKSKIKNQKSKVNRRLIKDLNTTSYKPLIPTSKGEKRYVLELMRGCTSGCRFCQAGFIYRPLREKEAKSAYDEAVKGTKECGLNQLSLLSLSTSDYSQIKPLAEALSGDLSKNNISISLPSLRLDDFSLSILEQVGAVRKTSLTFAIEAGSQRLRNLINKHLSEQQILSTLKGVFASGWTKVKLYFMVGLPTETEQDLEQLVDLVNKIGILGKETLPKNQRKRLSITVSISNFVPKAHTPFQWASQSSLHELEEKHRILIKKIKGPHFKLRWHDAEQSAIEGLIARGDEKVAEVIEASYKLGAQFDNFSERFDFKLWQEALKSCGVSLEDYHRQRRLEEQLPWDFIDTGVDKNFFKEEYRKGLQGLQTADCRIDKCPKCGLCNNEVRNRFSKSPSPLTGEGRGGGDLGKNHSPLSTKYRLTIKREGYYRYLSHLEWINLIERRLRAADIRLVTRGKYNPRPKFSFSQALPVGSATLNQHVDFESKQNETIEELEQKLKPVFHHGIVFKELKLLNNRST